jgi:hypothetical protein
MGMIQEEIDKCSQTCIMGREKEKNEKGKSTVPNVERKNL